MEALKRIASCLTSKWNQPYSKTCGYVKSSIAITLVQATHKCIRGSRVPANKQKMCRDRNGKTGRDWNCSGKNPPHHITTPPTTKPPRPHPRIRTKQRENGTDIRANDGTGATLRGAYRQQGAYSARPGNTKGGTGYTCPPLMSIEQTQTRIKINHYFQKINK